MTWYFHIFFEPGVRHEPAEVVGADPRLAVQREPALGDEQVQVRVPLDAT
jgi:hypothetical protein